MMTLREKVVVKLLATVVGVVTVWVIWSSSEPAEKAKSLRELAGGFGVGLVFALVMRRQRREPRS